MATQWEYEQGTSQIYTVVTRLTCFIYWHFITIGLYPVTEKLRENINSITLYRYEFERTLTNLCDPTRRHALLTK